jgi:hypothetical protein
MWWEPTPEVFPSILGTPCMQHKLHVLLDKDSHLRIIRLSARVQTAYSQRETIDVEFNIEVNV